MGPVLARRDAGRRRARVLKRGRAGQVGPEPVIAYVLGRETEVATLRALLVGKLTGSTTRRCGVTSGTRGRAMSRMAIVGDAVTVAGFRPLGFATFAVERPVDAREHCGRAGFG